MGLISDRNKIPLIAQIVAVTACAAGIAHTYMAAEALTKRLGKSWE